MALAVLPFLFLLNPPLPLLLLAPRLPLVSQYDATLGTQHLKNTARPLLLFLLLSRLFCALLPFGAARALARWAVGGAVDASTAPSASAAPFAESNGCGGCRGEEEAVATSDANSEKKSNRNSGCAGADAMYGAGGSEDGPRKTAAAAAAAGDGCTAVPATAGAGTGAATTEGRGGGSGGGEEGEDGVLKGMEGMSAAALVASFRRAQEERVALYRKFNGWVEKERKTDGRTDGRIPSSTAAPHTRSLYRIFLLAAKVYPVSWTK